MSEMPVTRDFIAAVLDGAEALRDRARELNDSPEFAANNSVGDIIRHGVEISLQRSAMMNDWARRAMRLLELK